jgi:hypothetical protein
VPRSSDVLSRNLLDERADNDTQELSELFAVANHLVSLVPCRHDPAASGRLRREDIVQCGRAVTGARRPRRSGPLAPGPPTAGLELYRHRLSAYAQWTLVAIRRVHDREVRAPGDASPTNTMPFRSRAGPSHLLPARTLMT